MEITCYKCKNTYEVPSGVLLIARLKNALGYNEHKFTCPNCGAKNALTAEEFRSNDIPQTVVPVTVTFVLNWARGHGTIEGSKAPLRGEPELNPVEDPGDGMQQRDAIVRVRGAEARRDHSTWSEDDGVP